MKLATLGALALSLICAATPAWAIRLDADDIFIEINDTDGDAGIQVFLDGEGWDTMSVIDPAGRLVLGIAADHNVGQQGVTELFLESAEPSFEEQPLDEFLALFPPGIYRFRGQTTEGVSLRGHARLTHALPDAPEILSPAEESTVDADNTVIEWERVDNPPGSSIVAYEVVVETEDPRLRVFKVDMGRNATSVTVPTDFMRPGGEYKVEVIAIERSGNRTITEVEFETE